jgi:hypothetical protein
LQASQKLARRAVGLFLTLLQHWSGRGGRGGAPYLQKMLAEKAVIDLKPFAADAKKRLAAAVGDFAAQEKGLRANVTVDEAAPRRRCL